MPSTASLPSAISGASDINTLMLANCDEPPSSQAHSSTCIHVLRPLPTHTRTQQFLQSRKEEESLREMAALFRDGIRTNLTGRRRTCTLSLLEIYRVSQALLCTSILAAVWSIFEYSHSVLLSQLDVLEVITEPSSLRIALTDCAAPLSRLVLALLLFFVTQHVRRARPDACTPLQFLGWGIALLVVQLLLTAFANRVLLLAQSSRLSLGLLLLPSLFLAATEVLLLSGSLLFFYQESPRRSQAILLALPFAARYCGSLVFYAALPVLNALCNIGSQTGSILRYEIGLVVQCVIAIVLLGLHTLFALRYDYVTEAELDQECESLKAERILHPYLMKVDPEKKSQLVAGVSHRNRSKSCESSRSSSTASKSPRSISDEIVLMSKSQCPCSLCSTNTVLLPSSLVRRRLEGIALPRPTVRHFVAARLLRLSLVQHHVPLVRLAQLLPLLQRLLLCRLDLLLKALLAFTPVEHVAARLGIHIWLHL